MDTSSLPELTRVTCTEDGRTKANFSDNSLLLLNPTGSAFVYVGTTGEQTRQLSEYALARLTPFLAPVLEFRNMHVEQPFVCKPLLRTQNCFTLGYVIRELWWPATAQDAHDKQLVQLQPDGRVVLNCTDQSGTAVLHFHRNKFAVCYPLLVTTSTADSQYTYVWHTQVFSLQSYPARWSAAVTLLLELASQVELNLSAAAEHTQPRSDPTPKPDEQQVVTLPAAMSSNLKLRSTPLPVATDRDLCGVCDQFRPGSWWFEPSTTLFLREECITLEWTPEATFQFHPELQEVEAWIHADESSLTSSKQGRFVEHRKAADTPAQLYAASCVPEYVWSHERSQRYMLGRIAAHALKLREQMAAFCGQSTSTASLSPTSAASISTIFSTSSEETFTVLSEDVLDESVVSGLGSFTAYADGRVRAFFNDRTVLHLNRKHTHCKLVLPNAETIVVSAANPVGVEQYVHAVADYAKWAFKTPEERSADIQQKAMVKAELLNARRMAVMCEYVATARFPGLVNSDMQQDQDAAQQIPSAAQQVPDVGYSQTELADPLLRQQVIEQMLQRNAQLRQTL